MRFLPLALAAFPISAMADTYSVASQPTAVTVYTGFAMVTREIAVSVEAGTHEIVLPDLPQWIDAGSLRASVSGANITSTRLRTDALPPQPDADSTAVIAAKAEIKRAELALRDLEDAVQDASLAMSAADARLNFLIGLASSKTLPTSPQELAELARMIDTETLVARQARVKAEREARRIDEGRDDLLQDIEDARATLTALTPPVEAKSLLALSIDAADAGEVLASVSYPARASWQPTYDVMLDRSEDAPMTLRRAALIYQNSGENWDGVALTLSTLAPSAQVIPSELFPTLLRFEDPQLREKLQRSAVSLTADMAGAPEPVMESMARPQPNFDGPGVTYSLPNPLSIAQGAEGARIELDALKFDARTFARAVPARDTTAFLMAEAINSGAEPLLAANSVQIFIDGSLVGRSQFAAVPAGAMFEQAFGPIEDLRLMHVLLDRSEGDRGIISRNNAQTQEVRMTIENLGTEKWDVELLDAVPYSEQDDLVIQWTAQPKPDVEDVDDRRGLLQWNITLAPETSQDVTVEQAIRWPDGKILR